MCGLLQGGEVNLTSLVTSSRFKFTRVLGNCTLHVLCLFFLLGNFTLHVLCLFFLLDLAEAFACGA